MTSVMVSKDARNIRRVPSPIACMRDTKARVEGVVRAPVIMVVMFVVGLKYTIGENVLRYAW